MSDTFLETLQADIVAILKATPSLADLNIVPEDDGDMEAKIARMVGTLQGPTGKIGAVAVVMLPEPTEAEPNLPGPPLTVRCQVQVIENTVINRDPANGTGIRSSVGALRVLQALHHHALATHTLYPPATNPIEPVPVKRGHLSHMVTLLARFEGLQSPGRPGAVTAQMVVTHVSALVDPEGANNGILVSSTDLDILRVSVGLNGIPLLATALTVASDGEEITVQTGDKRRMLVTADFGDGPETFAANYISEISDRPYYQVTVGDKSYEIDSDGLIYKIRRTFGDTIEILASNNPSYPDAATWPADVTSITAAPASAAQCIAAINAAAIPGVSATNAPGSDGTGSIAGALTVNMVEQTALQLTCATVGAAIYYTADGTYPTPADGTLYTAPIPGLETGDVVRAAAYSTGLLPGPLTEIEITD